MRDELKDIDKSIENEQSLDGRKMRAKKKVANVSKAKNVVSKRAEAIKENMLVYEGKLFEKDNGDSPWVVKMKTPYASVAIDTRVASLTASDYRGELFALNPEHDEEIRVLDKLIKDEFNRDNLNQKINACVHGSAISKENYLHIVWKKTKKGGYPVSYIIQDPASVLIDPQSNSLREAQWCAVTSLISEETIKDKYKEFYNEYKDMQDSASLSEAGELFSSSYNKQSGKEGMSLLITYYEKVKEGKNTVIEKTEIIGNYEVSKQKIEALSTFPIAQMRWKKEASSPYGLSLMDDIIELQKAISAIETATANVAVAYGAPSYLLKKDSGISPQMFAKSIGVPGMVLTTHSELKDVIQPLPFPKLDQSILNTKHDYIQAINTVAGITDPFVGSVGTAGNTARGTELTVERARIIEQHVLENISIFVEDITEILVQYVSSQYSGKKLPVRRTTPFSFDTKGETETEEVVLSDDIDNIEHGFYINLSAKTSYAKEREKEELKEFYQIQNQYDADMKLVTPIDILRSYELEDIDMYEERFKRIQELHSQEMAELLPQIVVEANKYGIDEGLIQTAVMEIIRLDAETPALEQLTQEIQAQAQRAQEMKIQGVNEIQMELENAGLDENEVAGLMQEQVGQQTGFMEEE